MNVKEFAIVGIITLIAVIIGGIINETLILPMFESKSNYEEEEV